MRPVTVRELMRAVIHDDACDSVLLQSDVMRLLDIALQKKIGVLALCEPARIELGNGHILNVTVEGKTPTPMKFSVQELRPEVLTFALLMEQRLRQKDADKGDGYKKRSKLDLVTQAISKAHRLGSEPLDASHYVDLANICMFIAHVSGTLDISEAEGTEGNGGPGWAALDQVQMP